MYEELLFKLRFAEKIAADSDKETWASLCGDAAAAIENLRRKYLQSEMDAINLTGELAIRPFWISVKDRLPEKSDQKNRREWFLVAMESGAVDKVAFEFDEDSCFGRGWHQTGSPVTHWMYLPKTPKEMEQNGYY